MDCFDLSGARHWMICFNARHVMDCLRRYFDGHPFRQLRKQARPHSSAGPSIQAGDTLLRWRNSEGLNPCLLRGRRLAFRAIDRHGTEESAWDAGRASRNACPQPAGVRAARRQQHRGPDQQSAAPAFPLAPRHGRTATVRTAPRMTTGPARTRCGFGHPVWRRTGLRRPRPRGRSAAGRARDRC